MDRLSIGNKIKELRFKVTEVLAHLEVSIDFAEEDVEEITYAMLTDSAESLRTEIKTLYDTAESGNGAATARMQRQGRCLRATKGMGQTDGKNLQGHNCH